jgi:aspartate carbamoyltransferase catalytic subunit
MPKKIINFLKEHNINFIETQDYKNWIKWYDILYTNRIQQERFPDNSEYLKVKDKYILWLDILDWDSSIIIMNPLPRINEIKKEVDSLPNAAYFRQAANWVPIRMALLYLLLKD